MQCEVKYFVRTSPRMRINSVKGSEFLLLVCGLIILIVCGLVLVSPRC